MNMQSFYEQLQRSAWIRSLLMLGVGAWIVIAPHSVFSVVVWLIAGALILGAITAFANGRRSGYGTMSGTGLLIAAVLVLLLSRPVVAALPWILGIMLVVYGINHVVSARRDQQFVNVSPIPAILYGILVIIAGVLLFFHPFGAAILAFRIFGGFLVVMAITELFGWLTYRNK